METVISKVCNNKWSGTDQHVRLLFKSIKKMPGKEDEVHHCRTDILDTGIIGFSVNDWATGLRQIWGHKHVPGKGNHNFLGECAKDFKPHDELMFKIEIVRPGAIIDDVEICRLIVAFGDRQTIISGVLGQAALWFWGDKNKKQGAWTIGPSDKGWGARDQDTEKGQSNWYQMRKCEKCTWATWTGQNSAAQPSKAH